MGDHFQVAAVGGPQPLLVRLLGIFAYGTNATTGAKVVLLLRKTELFLGKRIIPSPTEFGIGQADSMNTCTR
jgi:hypothetical protein